MDQPPCFSFSSNLDAELEKALPNPDLGLICIDLPQSCIFEHLALTQMLKRLVPGQPCDSNPQVVPNDWTLYEHWKDLLPSHYHLSVVKNSQTQSRLRL